MRTGVLMAIKEIPKRRGAVVILASILIGLILARFMMISPTAAIIALSFGIVCAFTVFLRKTDYLIYAWFVLTSVVFLIMVRLLPEYYAYVGRGIFWGLLFCIMAAWAIDNTLSGKQFVPFDNISLKVIILLFLLWSIATLFTSVDIFNSVKKLSHIVIGLGVSYIFYDFFSRDQDNIRKVLRLLLFVVTSICVIMIGVSGHSLISGVQIYKTIYLWFINPNVIGSLLFSCIPILITAGCHFISNKFLKALLIFVMLLGLFFSFHRTSWLAVLVSISYLLWKGRTRLSMAAAIIAIVFTVGLTLPLWGEDFYQYISGERYSGRKEIWQASWNAACDYPLFGTGLGNSIGIIDKYIDTPWLMRYETHSVYLQNALEMGFVSVVLLLAFYVTFLYSSENIERNLKTPYLKMTVRGTNATFLGLFVHGIFGNFGILTSFVAAEFWVLMPYILAALPFAAKRLEKETAIE